MDHLQSMINLTSGVSVGVSYWLFIPIVLLLILSGLFSASETAYSSASKIRLRTLSADGDKVATKALKLLERYDDLLSTVLIGNNIVNITLTTLVTVLFMQLFTSNEAFANVISTVVTTVVVLVFGEITPKTLARSSPEKVAKATYLFIVFCYYVLFPVNLIFKGWKALLSRLFKLGAEKSFTEEELVTIVETAESEGELDSHESMLIKNAIEFDDLEIKDIMVPRVSVTAITDDAKPDVVASVFGESGYSRLPVYHGTIDSVVGVLNEKDFNKEYYATGGEDYAGKIQPAISVAPSMKISVVLRMLQRARTHMAIVVDEFGGTAGIVTLEDILEELVGEIWDEHDEPEDLCRQVGDGEYVVAGFSNVSDVLKSVGVDTKEEFEATTVGGWVIERMGKIPSAGSALEFENIKITVTKANARRVLEVKIKVTEQNTKEREKDFGII